MTLEYFPYAILRPILLCKKHGNTLAPSSSVSTKGDQEIYELVLSSPKVDAGSAIPFGNRHNGGRVAMIAPDAVAKIVISHSEAEREFFSTEFVRKFTCIPVPRCERLSTRFCGPGSYLLQQFIPGRTLRDAWSSLGWWSRFRVIVTLRYYVHQLRCLTDRIGAPPFPGPPSVEGLPLVCSGRLFNSSGSGPFSSYRELAKWYQNRLLVIQRFRKEGLGVAPFDLGGPLVFTHLDLHTANLILGDDGQLWVIDWAHAGWYPTWFEAASMTLFSETHPDTPRSWSSWISFIAGSCEKPGQLPFIKAIRYSLECMRSDIMNLIDSQDL